MNESLAKMEENEMSQNQQYEKVMQINFIGQWITSLAITVICCAILFVVFAEYIVGVHEKMNLLEVRIDLMRENYSNLASEIKLIRRIPSMPLVQAPAPVPAPAVQTTEPAVVLEEVSGEVVVETPVVEAPVVETPELAVAEPVVEATTEPVVEEAPEPQIVQTPPVAAEGPTPEVSVASPVETAVEKLAPDAQVPVSNP